MKWQYFINIFQRALLYFPCLTVNSTLAWRLLFYNFLLFHGAQSKTAVAVAVPVAAVAVDGVADVDQKKFSSLLWNN